MTSLKRLQLIAVAGSAVFVIAALLTVLGVQIVPRDVPGLVAAFHVLLAVLGFLCGVAATRRRAEIDAERWRRVEDPDLTSGELAHAHREAESDLKRASAQFLLVGVTLGAWLAYQLRAKRPDAGAAVTELLSLSGEAPAVPAPETPVPAVSAPETPVPAVSAPELPAAETLASAPAYSMSASDLLIATPLVFFGLGMLLERHRASRADR